MTIEIYASNDNFEKKKTSDIDAKNYFDKNSINNETKKDLNK